MKVKLIKNAQMPTKGREGDAAWDLYLLEDTTIRPWEFFCLDTGVCLELDPGYAGMIVPRSSVSKRGISIANALIDSNYRGEIHVMGTNHSSLGYTFKKGDRIASLMIFPVYDGKLEQVDELSESNRGSDWNGSSNNLQQK